MKENVNNVYFPLRQKPQAVPANIHYTFVLRDRPPVFSCVAKTLANRGHFPVALYGHTSKFWIMTCE